MTQGFELFAKLGGDASGLQRALGNAQKSVSGAGQAMERMRRVGVRAFAALGAAAAAATATLVAFTRQGLRDVDQQAKLARSLDATIDGLRGVQIAAADAGVDTGALSTSLQMLNARTAEAARGTGSAAQAMQRLGLDAQTLMRMDVDERMAAIADRMNELGFSAAQAQDELGQLGIRNRQLALLMIQGGDAIRSARREVDEYGLSISEIDAQRIEQANDAFRRVGRVIERVKVELAFQLAPALLHVSNRFHEMIREAGGIDKIVSPAVQSLVRNLGTLGNGVRRIAILFATWRAGVASLRFTFLELNRFISGTFYKTIADIGQAIINLADRMSRIPFAPKIDTSGLQEFVSFSDNALAKIERMRDEALAGMLEASASLHRLLGEPMPSEEFELMMQKMRDGIEITRGKFEEAFKGITESAKDSADRVQDMFKTNQELALEAARGMQRAMSDFFFDPFSDGLKGMLRGFIDVVRRMVAEIMAQAVLRAFLNSAMPGAGFLSALMGRERGGPVMSGKPYMVGERGPEMFVPHGAGRVVPNNQLGGGSTMVTVNINAEDPGAEGRIRTMVERDMAPQIVQAAVGQTLGRLQRPSFA